MSRIETLLQHLVSHPNDRFAMYSVALEYKKAGDVAASEAAFQALLRAHPHSGAGHLQYGELLLGAGRTADAARAWRTGLLALKTAEGPDARRSIGEIQRALDLVDDDPETA